MALDQFSIGPVLLSGMEVPELLKDLGGLQELAVHRFPGGMITAQTYGAFPTPLVWSGILLGPFSLERSYQIDRLRVSGNAIVLNFGIYAWRGYVASYKAQVKNRWYLTYNIQFVPVQDLAGAGTPGAPSITPLDVVNQQLNTCALLSTGASTPDFPLPSAAASALGDVVSAVQGALQTAGNVLSAITNTAMQTVNTAISTFQGVANAALAAAGTLGYLAAPILKALAAVTVLQSALVSPLQPRWQIQVMNPILPLLAVQFYGDAEQWRVIAEANNLLDPMPTGYLNLYIPAPT